MRFTAVITHCRLAKHGGKADITLESFREGIAENYGVFCTVWTSMTRSHTQFKQNISPTIYLSVTKLGRLQVHRNTNFQSFHQSTPRDVRCYLRDKVIYSGKIEISCLLIFNILRCTLVKSFIFMFCFFS